MTPADYYTPADTVRWAASDSATEIERAVTAIADGDVLNAVKWLRAAAQTLGDAAWALLEPTA